MKNITTPRTLADCQFLTGYRSHRLVRRVAWREFLYGAASVAVFAGIGCLMAFRG